MIVFDLRCPQGHHFEGWFGSSDDFARQSNKGLVSCPQCGSQEVDKAPMAPAVPKKGNQQALQKKDVAPPDAAPISIEMPAKVAEALAKLAEAQTKMLEKSEWVGSDFAEQSRAMYYGEQDSRLIHGQVTAEEVEELLAEDLPIAPLLFPIAPPDEVN